MFWSRTKRVVFVHVYKTGGTSIRQAFAPYASALPASVTPHAPASKLKTLLGQQHPEVLDYLWFAVVRNPFDLVVSLWSYIKVTPKHHDHERVKHLAFSEFVQWLHQENNQASAGLELPPYPTISDFLCSPTGELLVDEVLRFETLDQDFQKLCDTLNFEIELPKLNQTKHQPFQNYYDELSIQLVSELFTDDLDRFNYQFESD